MDFKYLFFFWFLFTCSLTSNAQKENNSEIIEQIIETVAETNPEDFDYSHLVERLNYYHKNPIDLNKTNKNQLQELIFLNPLQISSLLDHIISNGKIIDILEIQSIDGFDLPTVEKLQYFSKVNLSGFENYGFNNILSNANHDFLFRYGRVLENQKGYNNIGSGYLGSKERLFLRYRYNYQDNLQISLNVEKDAGEPILGTKFNKGPDYVSGSILATNYNKFKKLLVGDYALQFGQGLSLWSGLSYGKGADIFSIARQDVGLKPYTSINEFSFLRGFATEIKFGKVSFIPFISYKKLDASSSTDLITNEELIGTLQENGLHRSSSEIENKNILSQTLYGTNIQFNSNTFSVGLNAYHTEYNKAFSLKDKPYNQFDFSGNKLSNLGLYYSYNFRNIYFFGEIAHSLNTGSAFLNGIISSITPIVSIVLLHRNYQKNYHSFFNQGISENTKAINEKGFYGGIQIKPDKKLDLNFYADVFNFPWLKFNADAPSNGYEIFSQLNYTPNKSTKLIIRYKEEEKQQNVLENVNINSLENVKKRSIRTEIQYQISKDLNFRNRVEILQFKEDSKLHQYGFLVYQDINYQPLDSKISGNLRFALFETAGFDTRIYAYENDVLYGYSIPGLQDTGGRFYLNGRFAVKKGIDLWLRYSITKYNNLEKISSGLEEIAGNTKSDIKLQLRFQFQ